VWCGGVQLSSLAGRKKSELVVGADADKSRTEEHGGGEVERGNIRKWGKLERRMEFHGNCGVP